jgi:hypothetical protein
MEDTLALRKVVQVTSGIRAGHQSALTAALSFAVPGSRCPAPYSLLPIPDHWGLGVKRTNRGASSSHFDISQ